MDWLPIVASALLGALIAAGVSWLGFLVNLRQKSVIDARQNWRDELRRMIPQFTSADADSERLRYRDAITLHLNPYKDRDLIETLDTYISDPSASQRRRVIDEFAVYLKYDWERAKAEAFHRSRRADRSAAKSVSEQMRARDNRTLEETP